LQYDLIVIGGGLAGAAFATRMSERGARVLLLEREEVFRDRIRGEAMHPWGVAEAKTLGIYEALRAAGAIHAAGWYTHAPGQETAARDVAATNPHGVSELCFYHPTMQETLFALASARGADTRRGVNVAAIEWGAATRVSWDEAGEARAAMARLVVGADGSQSLVRRSAGFEVTADSDRLVTAGVIVEGQNVADDGVHVFNGERGQVLFFPQGAGRARAYCVYQVDDPPPAPLSGERHKADFIAFCRAQNVPEHWLEGAELTSPLAQFQGADRWTPRPARPGVALVGDAAAKPDPAYGCGMSLALRDVRTLCDLLATEADWDRAVATYAAEHDRYFGALRRVELWFTRVFWDRGAEAEAIRERALDALQRLGVPDVVGLGPESPIPPGIF
jgi:2-polyprenyl-6-methoxyphenol hydroxylase-like FAD-dependent oxidoreductase